MITNYNETYFICSNYVDDKIYVCKKYLTEIIAELEFTINDKWLTSNGAVSDDGIKMIITKTDLLINLK